MKKLFIFVFAFALSFSVMGTVTNAAPLQDNGGGLIYDPNLNITWYDIPNNTYGLLPDAANTWAGSLNLGGVSGWRLPSTPGTIDGYTSEGEMGQLRLELGNTPGQPMTSGVPGFSFLIDDINNYIPTKYWTTHKTVPTVSKYGPGPWDTWIFNFSDGGYGAGPNYDFYYALAVHDGDIGPNGPITPGDPVTTPDPTTILLLGFGLTGVAGIRRKFSN